MDDYGKYVEYVRNKLLYLQIKDLYEILTEHGYKKDIKIKQTENNIPFYGYGEPRDGWIIDNRVLTMGCPFCCADRSASATYYANSSSWGMFFGYCLLSSSAVSLLDVCNP
ncbi:MAG: hypothetical protein ACE5J3_06150 [Methanosarcinales archaeon]